MKKIDFNEVMHSLAQRGFIEIPAADSASDIKFARQGLSRLLDTDPLRSDFVFPDDSYPSDELGEPLELGLLGIKLGDKKEGGKLGVFDRVSGRTHDDAGKNRFHFADALLPLLSRRAKSEYASMLRSCQRFNGTARTIALALATEFDRLNAISHEDARYPGSMRERLQGMFVITRLIRYHPLEERIPDAQVHCDRALFTVHHYSSAPGLRVFDKALVAHATDETNPRAVCCFTGEKFRIVTRGKFGSAAAHGVFDQRRLGAMSAPPGEMRFVAVTFVHCSLTADDVAWFHGHEQDFKLDRSLYKL